MPTLQIDNSDSWFRSVLPSDRNENGVAVVLGRFVWTKVPDVVKSQELDREVYRRALAIEHRVSGHIDVSVNKVNAENANKWINRFPEAWEAFKSVDKTQQVEGTPLTTKNPDGTRLIDGLSPEKAQLLLMEGIRTLEEFAEASDAVCVRMGLGSRTMRDKAREYLAEPAKRGPGRPRKDAAAELAEVGAV